MKTFVIILFSILLLSCDQSVNIKTNIPLSDNFKSINIWENWIVYNYRTVGIVALTENEANAFIGKKFEFQKEYAIINDIYYENPVYEEMEENAVDYFYRDKIYKEDIDFKADIVCVIKITCANNYFEIISYEDDIIMQIDGVYFFLKRYSVFSQIISIPENINLKFKDLD